jgi:plasmid stabilization system protein ParE
MSDRRLFYSPLARRDLDEIFEYISCELENPAAASGTVNAILDQTEKLEDFPFIGSIVQGLPFAADTYRFLGVRNYLVFYRVSESEIFVDRILYAKREYRTLLNLQ